MLRQDIGEALQQKYSEVFSGVGKLKDGAAQLHVDPNFSGTANTEDSFQPEIKGRREDPRTHQFGYHRAGRRAYSRG